MKHKNKKLIAFFALMSIILVAGVVLGAVTVLTSSKNGGKLQAWQTGGEFLGTGSVVMQDKHNNCGPAALKMVFDHYGITSTLAEIESKVGLAEKGSSMLALKEMAELKGLKAEGWRFTLEDFLKAPMPAIVFVHGDHFAVVDSITASNEILMSDPVVGKLKLSAKKLTMIWKGETLVFRK